MRFHPAWLVALVATIIALTTNTTANIPTNNKAICKTCQKFEGIYHFTGGEGKGGVYEGIVTVWPMKDGIHWVSFSQRKTFSFGPAQVIDGQLVISWVDLKSGMPGTSIVTRRGNDCSVSWTGGGEKNSEWWTWVGKIPEGK